jgi:hypothetical protein
MIYFVGAIGCLNIKDQLSSIKYSSGIISQLVVLVVVRVVLSVVLFLVWKFVGCYVVFGNRGGRASRGNRAWASVEKTHARMTHSLMTSCTCCNVPKKTIHTFSKQNKRSMDGIIQYLVVFILGVNHIIDLQWNESLEQRFFLLYVIIECLTMKNKNQSKING